VNGEYERNGRKQYFILFVIFLLQALHVLGYMSAVYVPLEDIGIQLLRLRVVPGEPFIGVGNEDPTVRSAFHGTKDSCTSGSALEAYVKETFEGPRSIFLIDDLRQLQCTIRLSFSLVLVG